MADTEVDTKEAPTGDTSRAFATRTLGVDMQARTVRAYITTPDLDADGDVVLPRGADLSRFKKNPIVFQVHNYGAKDVVGRVENLKMEDDGIIATVRFSPRPPTLPAEQDWLPDTILWLYHVGDLRGWSIGFTIQDARSPSKADRERWGDGLKRVITRWLMCELSSAPLPNNPSALTLSMKGLISERLAKVLESGRAPTRDELPDPAAPTKSAEAPNDEPDPDPDETTDSMPACPACKDEGDMRPDRCNPPRFRAYSCGKCGTQVTSTEGGPWTVTPTDPDSQPAHKVLLVPESAAGPDAAPVLIGIQPGPAPSAGTVLIGVPPAPPDAPAELLIEVPAPEPEAPPAPPESLLISIPTAPAEPDGPAALLIGVAPPEPETVAIELPPEAPETRIIALPTPPPPEAPAPEPEPETCLIQLPQPPAASPPAPPESLLIGVAAAEEPKSLLIELPPPEPEAACKVMYVLMPPPAEPEVKAVAPDFGRVVAASVAMGLAKARGRLFV